MYVCVYRKRGTQFSKYNLITHIIHAFANGNENNDR